MSLSAARGHSVSQNINLVNDNLFLEGNKTTIQSKVTQWRGNALQNEQATLAAFNLFSERSSADAGQLLCSQKRIVTPLIGCIQRAIENHFKVQNPRILESQNRDKPHKTNLYFDKNLNFFALEHLRLYEQ